VRLGNSNSRLRPHRAQPQPLHRGTDHAERHQLDAPRVYPSARPMGGAEGGHTPELLWRMESTDGEVTLGDTTADLFSASGTPDKWRVTARAFGALIVPTNILDQEEDAILVPAGETVEFYVPRRKLRARNATAASNATVSAEAYFRGPVFRFDAR
jgi:hypothetical protein